MTAPETLHTAAARLRELPGDWAHLLLAQLLDHVAGAADPQSAEGIARIVIARCEMRDAAQALLRGLVPAEQYVPDGAP